MNVLPYLGILVAAAVEGEVVYSGAVVMVFLGRLNPFGVLISGSIGGWGGGQFFFFAARGKFCEWLKRFSKNARRRRGVQERMHPHAIKLILSVRFFSGFGLSIPL